MIREALGSLAGHPLRSALTALSVAFGAAVLLILLSYATGMPETTADVLRSLGSKEMIVEPRRSWGSRGGRKVRIRYVDLPTIRDACPSISSLAPAYSPGRGGPVFSADKSWPWVRTTGVGHEYREVTDLRIVGGRWFSKLEEQQAEEVALISLPLALGMFADQNPQGESMDAWGRRFEIVGVFESNASFAYTMLVPYPTAMEMGDTGGRYVSHIAFAPIRPDLAPAAIDEIRNALATLYSFDPDDPTALDIKENAAYAAKVEAASLGLETLVMAIAALTLVLGCLGAANVVGIAVAERTGELGLRKALGATAGRLRGEVLVETLMLCLVGGAVGAGVGSATIAALGPLQLTEEARLIPSADPDLLMVAFILLVATATLAGWPAANRAARLDPIEALRDE